MSACVCIFVAINSVDRMRACMCVVFIMILIVRGVLVCEFVSVDAGGFVPGRAVAHGHNCQCGVLYAASEIRHFKELGVLMTMIIITNDEVNFWRINGLKIAFWIEGLLGKWCNLNR